MPVNDIKRYEGMQNNYDGVLDEIYRCLIPEYTLTDIGYVGDVAIGMVAPKRSRKNSVLVVAGFHGNEVAGVWGIVEYIRRNGKALSKMDLGVHFIPVCNHGGFTRNKRYNKRGEPSNVFCDKQGELLENLSKESRILADIQEDLHEMSQDGVLACHEDESLAEDFYIYSYGNDVEGIGKELVDTGGEWFDRRQKEKGKSKKRKAGVEKPLLDAGSKWFTMRPDGVYSDKSIIDISKPDEYRIDKGVVVKGGNDGSFEYWLAKNGSRIAFTVETPMKADFSKRVMCHVEYIEAFVNMVK